jgi:pimeloyl-ACP methyl ester carboxylesterase
MVVPDRPGYGGSARQHGRTVADVADDAQLLADAQGWAQFAVAGNSGGGPHALACAALLPGRVRRGHLQDDSAYRRMLAWLHGGSPR